MSEQMNPSTVAKNQVWDVRHHPEAFVVADIEGDRAVSTCNMTVGLKYLLAECRCIGIETPAGRVMVGERREHREVWTVVGVVDDYSVMLECEEAERPYSACASMVATWPLVPAPLAKAAESAERSRVSPAEWCAAVLPRLARAAHLPSFVSDVPAPAVPRSPAAAAVALRVCSLCRAPSGTCGHVFATTRLTTDPHLEGCRCAACPGAYVTDPEAIARLTGLPLVPIPAPRSPVAAVVAMSGAVATVAGTAVTFTLPVGTPEHRRRDVERFAQAALAREHVLPCVLAKVVIAEDPREARRREIDRVLREDARRFPAFATARRAAVLAGAELARGVDCIHPSTATGVLMGLHRYEDARGGQRRPAEGATEVAFVPPCILAAYERARGLP